MNQIQGHPLGCRSNEYQHIQDSSDCSRDWESVLSVENKLKIQIHSVEVEKVMQQLDIEGLMNFLYDKYREAREQEVWNNSQISILIFSFSSEFF